MPKLSIITVNLNNAPGLQKTMESVFAQTFTDYECIIIDGGSADGSKEIIEKHADKLAYWGSEKDKGIYHAMNKGISKAGGEYLLFLNSGDYLYKNNSLEILINDSGGKDLVYGDILIEEDKKLRKQGYPAVLNFDYFVNGRSLPHQATLIKKELFEKTGVYNENYKMVADWEFFINAVCLYNASYQYVEKAITVYGMDGFSADPANVHLYGEERDETYKKHYGNFLPLLERSRDYEQKLKLIKSSRMHRAMERILRNPVYKLLKKNLKL